MSDKQLAFKDDEIVRILNHVYNLFRSGEFSESAFELEKALKIDFDYPGVTSSLKCANFWAEKQEKLKEIEDRYERGEFLMLQWRHFTSFVERIGDVSEQCLYAVKHYVFAGALDCYESIYEESGLYDSDILLQIGRCHKAIGNYEKAIEFLEIASQQRRDSPPILIELADCHSLVGEMRISKAFFREAFFIDPQEIDLNSLECVAISRLVDKLKEKGFTEPELLEWIPVYGAIYGVFNVKRELRPIEFGKLKQTIFKYENEIREGTGKKSYLVPRLINHYFWLIDHYTGTGEEKSKVQEVLLKLKKLDPIVYKEFIQ